MNISELIGKTLASIFMSERNDEITFTTDTGDTYRMAHDQDCCESVSVDDVAGDFLDLIGSPILKAEESKNQDKPRDHDSDESFTWTFYHLATVKGYVTIRWYGSSNGFYSESVDFERIACPPPQPRSGGA